MRSTIFFCFVQCTTLLANAEVTYLFSHGLGDSHKQAYAYTQSSIHKKPYIIQDNCVTFDYLDVGKGLFRLNRLQTSMAQDNEIKRLAEVFYSSCNTGQVILVGVSRGASAIINFMGFCDPHNVSALVLESPFDCIDSIAQKMIHETRWGCVPGIRSIFHNLFSFVFCKYNPHGVRPIDTATHIRKDLPILIICCTNDKLVPVWSSINLYIQLRESGHEHAYLLIMPEGVHGRLIRDPDYQYWYQNVTHAFYKKYGLPHNPEFAKSGTFLFETLCQPPVQNLQSFYPHYLKKYPNHTITWEKSHSLVHKKMCCMHQKKRPNKSIF